MPARCRALAFRDCAVASAEICYLKVTSCLIWGTLAFIPLPPAVNLGPALRSLLCSVQSWALNVGLLGPRVHCALLPCGHRWRVSNIGARVGARLAAEPAVACMDAYVIACFQ